MPVTFSPAPHNAIEPCKRSHYVLATCTPVSLLADVTAMQDKRKGTTVKEHLQSTFGRDSAQPIPVVPSRNGFVATVIEAYSNHQALVIRPDDVWICILSQFSLFLNGGRAEQLRHLFVAHEGKQRLTINMIGTRSTVDFGAFAQVMTDQIHENVVDPELQAWFLPAFSTTTSNDTIVASAVMMATLKSYFDYQAVIMRCGLPRVTLLGTQADWRDIFDRLDRLGRYGPETTAWRRLLEPVLARFVRTFEPGYADSAENRHFWQHVASRQWGGSGMSSPWLTGWITAFCAFDVDGSYKGSLQAVSPLKPSVPSWAQWWASLSTPKSVSFDWAKTQQHTPLHNDTLPQTISCLPYVFGRAVSRPAAGHSSSTITPALEVDGVRYLTLDPSKVPFGHTEVDIFIHDNGQDMIGKMVAGLVGMDIRDACTDDGTVVPDGEVRPVLAWWMFIP